MKEDKANKDKDQQASWTYILIMFIMAVVDGGIIFYCGSHLSMLDYMVEARTFLMALAIALLLVFVFLEQKIIKKYSDCLKEKTFESIDALYEEAKKEHNEYDLRDFRKEKINLELTKIEENSKELKEFNLKWVTYTVGVLEVIMFVALAFFLMKEKGNSFNLEKIPKIIMEIAKYAGGWLGLKIVGNYQKWSGAIFGRANFYKFLLPSILNIILAVIIGFVGFWLWDLLNGL
ncbi:hypothetical protein ACFL11_00670 [Patescibacteria group bacterium]